jgi:pimeloyl-ACP methyl ester carboxylesterase
MKSMRRHAVAILAAISAAVFVSGIAQSNPPTLSIVERGKGDPALVLIHGLGQDRGVWDRVSSKLAGRHRLILVDLPGHGSSAAISPITLAAVADELDRSLKAQKVKKAILVGHSYGGLVALQEAASHPDRTLGVVSIDLATYTQLDSSRVANLEMILKQRYLLFVQGVFEPMVRDSSQVDSVLAKAERVSPDVMAAYFRDAWHVDLRPEIKTLKTPVLLVATDVTWPAAESWSSARKRLGYETAGRSDGHRIWESGHLIPLDQPDSLAAAIEDFASSFSK